jgi:hypothetical protein
MTTLWRAATILTPTMENLPMMVEANHSLSQVQSRITTASFVLALQRARGVVKEELKRQRVRIADVEAKEITARAKDYLIAHPELIADARPVVESWFARGVFGKRAARAFKEGLLNGRFEGDRSVANG